MSYFSWRDIIPKPDIVKLGIELNKYEGDFSLNIL